MEWTSEPPAFACTCSVQVGDDFDVGVFGFHPTERVPWFSGQALSAAASDLVAQGARWKLVPVRPEFVG